MKTLPYLQKLKKMPDTDVLRDLIEPVFSDLELRLHGHKLDQLLEEMALQPEHNEYPVSTSSRDRHRLSIVHKAIKVIEKSDERKEQIIAKFQALSGRLSFLSRDEEKQKLTMEFLEFITPDKKSLKGDKKAFERYMGLDVIAERYNKIIVREEFLQKMALDVIGNLVAGVMKRCSDKDGELQYIATFYYILSDLQLQKFLLDKAEHAGLWQSKVAAFNAFAKIARAMPESEKSRILDFDTSRSITKYCLNTQESIWIQISALRLLSELSREECLRAFRVRLIENDDHISDNLFVRKAILEIIGESFVDEDGLEILEELADRKDKSEYVRMQLVKTIASFQSQEARYMLKKFVMSGFDEDCPQVRAQAVIEWSNLGRKALADSDAELLREYTGIITWAITRGDDLLVQRVALEEAAQVCNVREEMLDKNKVDAFDKRILDAVSSILSSENADLKLKRWAGETWEQIVVKNLSEYKALEKVLNPKIDQLKEGESLVINSDILLENEKSLGRALAFFSRRNFGLYVELYPDFVRLSRGDKWKHSLWRFLHEIRNLNPDKRQAFSHTIARRFTGTIRAHPGILAEVTKTKVPGERLYIEHEGSWRRFIPLLDDYLSLSRDRYAGRAVEIFSSYGKTTIRGPEGWWARMKNYLGISWNYAKISDLRNANPKDKEHFDPAVYIDTMRQKYGITTDFSPYSYRYDEKEYFLQDETIERVFQHELDEAMQ